MLDTDVSARPVIAPECALAGNDTSNFVSAARAFAAPVLIAANIAAAHTTPQNFRCTRIFIAPSIAPRAYYTSTSSFKGLSALLDAVHFPIFN